MTSIEQHILTFIMVVVLFFGAFTFGCITACDAGQCFICRFRERRKRK